MPKTFHVQLTLDESTYNGLMDYSESYGYSPSGAVKNILQDYLQSAGWYEWQPVDEGKEQR